MKSNRVEFDLPEGFTLPEGTEPGSEFDLVCTFRLKKNKKLCLTELGDFDMPGYDDKEDASEPLKPGEYGQAKQMMTAGAPQPMSGGY